MDKNIIGFKFTVDKQYFLDNDYKYDESLAFELDYYVKEFEGIIIRCCLNTKQIFVHISKRGSHKTAMKEINKLTNFI